MTLAPDIAQSSPLRRQLREWCLRRGVRDGLADDLVLVTSELFTNAAKATVGGAMVAVDVRQRSAGGLRVAVANRGEAFDHVTSSLPPWEAIGGRGLVIADALGRLSVRSAGGTTVVDVVLRQVRRRTPVRAF